MPESIIRQPFDMLHDSPITGFYPIEMGRVKMAVTVNQLVEPALVGIRTITTLQSRSATTELGTVHPVTDTQV